MARSRRGTGILAVSYIFDWFILLVIGLITVAFNVQTPNYHPFSLLDLSISYPNVTETISITSLVFAAVVGPAIVIVLFSLLLIPGPAQYKHFTRGQLWRFKIWEWNVGWLGLGLSLLTSVMIVSGVKNVIGKPRPDALAVCNPNLAEIAQNTVGGFGTDISSRWVLVNYHICQQDLHTLKDAFRSFPSGHSATAFSGLLYLSLYLSSKLGLAFPSASMKTFFTRFQTTVLQPSQSDIELKKTDVVSSRDNCDEAAAAPTWVALVMFIPIAVATFIAGSRYYNYKHHGFDVLAGCVVGIATAWFGFRWYHPALSTGSGWAWGPRSPERAFGVGVGNRGFVVDDAVRFSSFNEPRPDSLMLAQGNSHTSSNMASIPAAISGPGVVPAVRVTDTGYSNGPMAEHQFV